MMFENINEGLLDFLEKSPTAFHAVSNIRAALQASGYTELSESQKWELRRGGRYFTVRNESSVIAFRIPQEDYTHFMIAAAHSDSPSFKIKANPEVKAGPYVKLNVEKYGGMLIAPWFDRPLSVAGRLIVQDENGGLTTRLVNVDRDLLMLPSLAIHMDREANSGHAFNVQNEVMPLFGDETSAGHFMEIVAQAAGVKKEAILGDDLFLYARGRGTVFGADHEYLSAGHLDDLQCVYAALQGFIASGNSTEKGCRAAQGTLPVFAVFDNEEVGGQHVSGRCSEKNQRSTWRRHGAASPRGLFQLYGLGGQRARDPSELSRQSRSCQPPGYEPRNCYKIQCEPEIYDRCGQRSAL